MPSRSQKLGEKRAAAESTPDRKRAAAAKIAARGGIAPVPDFPTENRVEKVEMSAATIAMLVS